MQLGCCSFVRTHHCAAVSWQARDGSIERPVQFTGSAARRIGHQPLLPSCCQPGSGCRDNMMIITLRQQSAARQLFSCLCRQPSSPRLGAAASALQSPLQQANRRARAWRLASRRCCASSPRVKPAAGDCYMLRMMQHHCRATDRWAAGHTVCSQRCSSHHQTPASSCRH